MSSYTDLPDLCGCWQRHTYW